MALGIYSRVIGLGAKPLQFDEAVNWHLAKTYALSGQVPYDPQHFHGPLFFRIVATVGLDSEFELRLPSVAAGLLLLLVCVGVAWKRAGLGAAASAAALIALDPLIVFYNRTAIHESVFAFLSLLCTFLFWYLMSVRTWKWALLTGLVCGLLAATKETFVISVLSSILPLLYMYRSKLRVPVRCLLILFVGAFISTFVAFDSFTIPFELLSGVWNWSKTGLSDSTQFQPWWFYFERVAASSPLVVFALFALVSKDTFSKYLSVQGIIAFFLYSLIPYKTPWLLMSVIAPLGLAAALQMRTVSSAFQCSAIMLCLNFMPSTTAYLQLNDTSPDVRQLASEIETHCAEFDGTCEVFIGAKWYWPLPFYLRSLQGKVYYADGPRAIPLEKFDVIVLPVDARDVSGWSRKDFRLSRVQRVGIFWRTKDL